MSPIQTSKLILRLREFFLATIATMACAGPAQGATLTLLPGLTYAGRNHNEPRFGPDLSILMGDRSEGFGVVVGLARASDQEYYIGPIFFGVITFLAASAEVAAHFRKSEFVSARATVAAGLIPMLLFSLGFDVEHRVPIVELGLTAKIPIRFR